MNDYNNYTKEDLIRELEILKKNSICEDDGISNANKMLANMITLRKTFSDVLSLLMSSESNEVINQALFLILKFFDVDRVYIGIFDEKETKIGFTHEVTNQRTVSMKDELLGEFSEDEMPWWVGNIKASKDIVVYDVDKMPKEAKAEQDILRLQDIKSLLALPVIHASKVSGFIGLDAVREKRIWSMLDIENLRMLADIISIATERERAQRLVEHTNQQILMSEAKFQIIFEKLPWGVELYDAEGNLLDLNDADLAIFGTTREQTIGVNVFKNPNIPDWVNEKLRKGEDASFTLDYNFQTVSDTGYYVSNIQGSSKHLVVKGITLKDKHGVIFGYLYIVFDNTDNYNKAEETLYNLAKLKVAVNTGESVIWEYDVATDKLVVDFSLNDDVENNEVLSAIRKQGFTSIDDFISTMHPDDLDGVYNTQFKQLLNGEINNYIAVYRRILEGKLFWFQSNVRAYKLNSDGTPSKIVSYTSNITQQRESERELIRVREADKLKSAFLANMSHEIRTPLNAIVGFSDIVAETSDEEERQTYLDIIHKNNDLLLHLIDDILDFSKIESGTLEYHITDANIKDICGEVYLATSLKVKPEVKLIFDKDLPPVYIKTDAQRIMQVIANFVNNAIKFTQSGSITISYKKEKNDLKVCVKDTGIGISEENRARIFERFIKINDFKQGTGLGLTISKTIIESLGGTIGVDSVVGEGSTFWFTLPLKDEEIEQKTSRAEHKNTPIHSSDVEEEQKSILIAEDIPENYLLLKALLHSKYQLYHALNGEEAIRLYEEKKPDLILMDIRMPVMDGFDATRAIRKLSETIPIIALTAFAFDSEKKMAKECGFTDYVVKPVDVNKLKDLVFNIFSI